MSEFSTPLSVRAVRQLGRALPKRLHAAALFTLARDRAHVRAASNDRQYCPFFGPSPFRHFRLFRPGSSSPSSSSVGQSDDVCLPAQKWHASPVRSPRFRFFFPMMVRSLNGSFTLTK